MDINEMTLEQLKALAYDQIVARERIQNSINAIIARIAELEHKQADEKETD